MRTRAAALAVAAVGVVTILGAVSCGKPVDLAAKLEVVDMSTGWADAGITEDGQNKLVPFIKFRLKNNSDQNLPVLQVNAMFQPAKEEKEWGSRFQSVTGSEGLKPGATTPFITLQSDHGAKGTDPRATIMKSQYFVDARARLTAKYGSIAWTKLGEYPVKHEFVE
ncbi:MAG TPA: hypothetical protein VN628_04735 [Vicinamibacterales bacterium]|nr:hypothetical protein [Vicinamibacterales bacterium]